MVLTHCQRKAARQVAIKLKAARLLAELRVYQTRTRARQQEWDEEKANKIEFILWQIIKKTNDHTFFLGKAIIDQ